MVYAALTSRLLARLALKTGAPIVPFFARLAPAGRYRVAFHPPVDTAVDGDQAVEQLTERCLAVVEAEIRLSPEQWLWLHRRWKT